MSDAPKRMWVAPCAKRGWPDAHADCQPRPLNPKDTAYIRADLFDAQAAEIERLREALTKIVGGASPDHWVPQYFHCVDIARAALASTEGQSDG